MTPHAFVINLDRDDQKLAKVARRLADVNIPFERLPAVDGRRLQPEVTRRHCTPACATFCPPAAVGCFLSHKRAWQAVVDRGLPEAYVFEDDVAFHPGAVDVIAAARRELPPDFDVMLLGCFTCEEEMVVEYLLGVARGVSPARTFSPHLTVPSQTFGSQAYLVSARGARRLLSALARMSATVDWQMGAAMKL
ncbi:MAG: glycosyltransferase family 25 protein, partial [Deltaproteobacteria bacterium]